MIVRFCLVLCLAARLGSEAAVSVKNNAYQDLLISFAPEVNPEDGKEIVDKLKDLLKGTSDVLYTAFERRIGSVTFHLPSTWDTSSWENVTQASTVLEGEEDILVGDVPDSAFGERPFALQYGGCAIPGHKIIIQTTFLNADEGYPKGKLLAREWLKYRYGVFDENGFDGDDMYPAYYQIPGTVDVKITECTDPEVEYEFKNSNGTDCSLEIPFASDDCQIHPKENSLNVTSSLMYFHQELPLVKTVCGDNHKEFTPSKHNILCNERSMWDVLEMSKDFSDEEGTTTVSPQTEEEHVIEFSYLQESKPRVVIVFEDSGRLHAQREMILFAFRRFIYDLPDGSDFGLYSFTEAAVPIRPLTELTSEAKKEVNIQSLFAEDNKPICVSCAVSEPVEALSEKPDIQGSFILVADSTSLDDDQNLLDTLTGLKLKERNLCLTIVAFTNNSQQDPPAAFKDLVSVSNCIFLLVVHKEKENSHEIFEELHQIMHNAVPHSPATSQTKTVVSGTMSDVASLDIPMDPTSEKYTMWLSTRLEYGNYIKCKAGDKDINVTIGVKGSEIASYSFKAAEDDVNCKLSTSKVDAVSTHVEMTTKPGEYFKEEVWIHDTSGSGGEQMPVIIFARINFGNYPIQDAKVVAKITGPRDLSEELMLFDNGRGDPDITQNDGIYSRYFVGFTDEGEYTVTVTAENENSTRVGKKGADGCCGSKVKSESDEVHPFKRSMVTSFNATGKRPDGGYKPSRILDLRVDTYDPMTSILLKWTAPGGEGDNGNASSYEFHLFCKSEDCQGNGTLPPWIKFNNSMPTPNMPGQEELVVLLLSGAPNNDTLSIGLKSINQNKMHSDISNLVMVELDSSFEPPTTKDPGEIRNKKAGQIAIRAIVGGSVFGLFLLMCIAGTVYYFGNKVRGLKANNFKDIPKPEHINCEFPEQVRASNIDTRDSSMRRVESFPVLLYTHDQIKDFKNKKGKKPPLGKEDVRSKPWMSLDALPSKSNKDKDGSSDGSASTMPANDSDRHLTEMKELDDNKSHTSELHLEKVAKF